MATLNETLTILDSVLKTLVCSDAGLHGRVNVVLPQLKQLSEKDIPPDFRKDYKKLPMMIVTFNPEKIQADLEYSLALSIYQLNKRLVGETGFVIGFPKKY